LTNPSLDNAMSVRIKLAGGARATEARGTILTHPEKTATNTFVDPNQVRPATHSIKIAADALQVTLPKQSIVLVECNLT
jgi:alpha-L-arabinofuranosidase